MSRIGKQPITVPAGVDVTIDGTTVTVKGPKGELTRSFPEIMIIKREGDDIIVERPDDSRDAKAFHGLVRTLIANMVEGTANGFSKKLQLVGVGALDKVAGSIVSNIEALCSGGETRRMSTEDLEAYAKERVADWGKD